MRSSPRSTWHPSRQQLKSFAQETGILDVLNAMNTVQTTISSTMNDINKAIGPTTYGDTNTLLQQGFTQNANYSKAQVGAWQQITDASNVANSQFQMQVRQAQIRDEHTVSPNSCTALDGGVSATAAAVQGYNVSWTIAATHNARGQAQPGMPSYYGAAQGTASMGGKPYRRITAIRRIVDAGLCPNGISTTPDADSAFSSLYNSGTYGSAGGHQRCQGLCGQPDRAGCPSRFAGQPAQLHPGPGRSRQAPQLRRSHVLGPERR